jgi:signal transduction histidine kinase
MTKLWFLTAVLGCLIVAVALVFWRVSGRPSRAFVGAIERIAQGELQERVPEAGASSILAIARAINTMAGALERERAEIQRVTSERAALEKTLMHAQTLAAAWEVADLLAHEIGSPLNTILGRARLAAGHPECPGDVLSALETIAGQSERIAKVMGDTLSELRRPRSTAGGQCDLVQVAQRALSFVEPLVKRTGSTVRLEHDAISSYVEVDDARALQIVVNACLHAVESQRDKNEVTLRIRGGHGTAVRPQIVLEIEGCRGASEFGSNGLGGNGSNQPAPSLFGSGLNLLIARGLVAEVGGLVALQPIERGGSMCRITLPASNDAARRLEAKK